MGCVTYQSKMSFWLVYKILKWQLLVLSFLFLSYWTKQFPWIRPVVLKKHLIRRLLGLITFYPEKIFIFAVLRSFVFKYHISVRSGVGRTRVLAGQSVAGSMRGDETAGPHPLRGQRVQLVGAHGDGLVQGLHGGPAGGPRVEAGRLLLPLDALPVPLTGPAPSDLRHYKLIRSHQHITEQQLDIRDVAVLTVRQSTCSRTRTRTRTSSNLHNIAMQWQQITATYRHLALFVNSSEWYLMIIMMVILHKDNSQSDDWSHHIQTRP